MCTPSADSISRRKRRSSNVIKYLNFQFQGEQHQHSCLLAHLESPFHTFISEFLDISCLQNSIYKTFIMRTAGLSLLVALTALHAIAVNGDVSCNTRSMLPAISATRLNGIQDRLSNMVSALCHTPSRESGTISEHLEGFVFELHRDKAAQDVKECQVAFAAIISQCIGTGKTSGAESDAEKGITYLVYPSSPDDHRSNHARVPGPAKPAPAKAAPVKPPSSPAKPSPASLPTKTIKIGPTKNCQQLALLMQKPTKNGNLARKLEAGRGSFVGSRVDIKNRQELAKRALGDDDEWDGPGAEDTRINHEGSPKKGFACGITFDALNYPKAASMVRIIP